MTTSIKIRPKRSNLKFDHRVSNFVIFRNMWVPFAFASFVSAVIRVSR